MQSVRNAAAVAVHQNHMVLCPVFKLCSGKTVWKKLLHSRIFVTYYLIYYLM